LRNDSRAAEGDGGSRGRERAGEARRRPERHRLSPHSRSHTSRTDRYRPVLMMSPSIVFLQANYILYTSHDSRLVADWSILHAAKRTSIVVMR